MPTVISLSGGVDSTVLLAMIMKKLNKWSMNVMEPVYPVFFDYGQRHKEREMTAAKNVCHHYGVNPLIVFDISSFFREVTLLSPHNFSALLEGETLEIPMESQKKPYLTVVPGRNTIFISHLLAVAQATQSHLIHLAVHRGDHAVYPDCRPVYLEHMNHAIIEASDAKVTLQTPFRDFSKADIIRIGKDLKVPFGMTWTCYKGGILPCGVCDACVGRLNAFREAGVASTEEPIRSESIQG